MSCNSETPPPAEESAEGLVAALLRRWEIIVAERDKRLGLSEEWYVYNDSANLVVAIVEMARPYEARLIAAERRVRELEASMNRWIADARQSMPGLGLAATQYHPPMLAGLRRIENALDCMARVYADGLSTAPANGERVGEQGAEGEAG